MEKCTFYGTGSPRQEEQFRNDHLVVDIVVVHATGRFYVLQHRFVQAKHVRQQSQKKLNSKFNTRSLLIKITAAATTTDDRRKLLKSHCSRPHNRSLNLMGDSIPST